MKKIWKNRGLAVLLSVVLTYVMLPTQALVQAQEDTLSEEGQSDLTRQTEDESFRFSQGGQVKITYDPSDLSYCNKAQSDDAGAAISYAIVAEKDLEQNSLKAGSVAKIDASGGKLTYKRSGIVTVTAWRCENDSHRAKEISYTLTIEKAQQKLLEAHCGEVKFMPDVQQKGKLSYSGGTTQGAVRYEITRGSDVAEIEDNKIKTKKTGTFYVQAVMQGDDCYQEAVSPELAVTVGTGSQAALALSCQPLEYRKDVYQEHKLSCSGGSTNGKVTYTITEGAEIAEIDDEGRIKTLKPGRFWVQASMEGNENYDAVTSAPLLVTVDKGTQRLVFSGEQATIAYGTRKSYGDADGDIVLDESGALAPGEVTYRIQEEDAAANVLCAGVNTKSGVVSFDTTQARVGTITIRAEKPGDDYYKAASASYRLCVVYADVGSAAPLSNREESKKAGAQEGYYASAITFMPPAGYEIGTRNDLDYEEWSAGELEYGGAANEIALYLKNTKTGAITGAYTYQFYVDAHAPEDLTISYNRNVIGAFLANTGFYKERLKVCIRAKDSLSGIRQFQYRLGGQELVTIDMKDTKADREGYKQYEFYIEPQFKGSITAWAGDMAGNMLKVEDGKTVVVDNIAPTCQVSYREARQMDGGKYYYDANITLKVSMAEDNFYSGDVKITVDGVEVSPRWTADKNTEISLKDEGRHVVRIQYTDRSQNQMIPYTSPVFVIDKTKPVVKVAYGNQDAVKTIDGRKYFREEQTATITVREDNFRAKDIKAVVTAVDALGEKVDVQNYAAYLKKSSSWKTQGNVHTAKISFSRDANYSFAVSFEDLAKNTAKKYKTDSFTVDKTAPENLKITYRQSLLDTVLDNVSMGYYDAVLDVTISAEERTSDIDYFLYDAARAAGVSGINKEQLAQRIDRKKLTRLGYTSSVTFSIPAGEVNAVNQFRGSLRFTACDIAGNARDSRDDKQLVVDTIAPNASVNYNTPLKTVDGVSYYSGNITASIVIDEANFVPSEVSVLLARDGGPAVPTAVSWSERGTDIHETAVSITEDGDYMLFVQYSDRSGNQMADYVSQRLVRDTVAPVISVSDVSADSAYNGETVGFTVSVHDVNLDTNAVTPTFTAVTMSEQGEFSSQAIAYEASVAEDGETYIMSVPNLEEDAVCTIACEARDMADNSFSMLGGADGNQYTSISFSVNRNGSTFVLDDDTRGLTEQYYVQDVQKDVVLREINVSLADHYAVRLNDEVLSEGSDYTTTSSRQEGQWNIRTYAIARELFAQEGEYNIVVESVDSTETAAYSDVKNAAVKYVVDRTEPMVTYSGLQEGETYRVDRQKVVAIPRDDGGMLKSFKAVIMNADGENETTAISLEGKELSDYLASNDGMVSFDIPEGIHQQVRVICSDYAVDSAGKTNTYDQIFRAVTVSSSGVAAFMANKALVYGGIAVSVGIVTAVGGAFFFRKRRSKMKR